MQFSLMYQPSIEKKETCHPQIYHLVVPRLQLTLTVSYGFTKDRKHDDAEYQIWTLELSEWLRCSKAILRLL